MDIKTFLLTFVTIFLAEIGDKTQFTVFAFSIKNPSYRLSIFLGACCALVLSSLIAVILGEIAAKFIPLEYLRIACAILFIAIGAWMLIT